MNWEYVPHKSIIIGALGFPVATSVASENGPVMAASKDLLEALEDVMSWISNWDPNFIHDSEWPASREKAQAAIAKVKGGAQ